MYHTPGHTCAVVWDPLLTWVGGEVCFCILPPVFYCTALLCFRVWGCYIQRTLLMKCFLQVYLAEFRVSECLPWSDLSPCTVPSCSFPLVVFSLSCFLLCWPSHLPSCLPLFFAPTGPHRMPVPCISSFRNFRTCFFSFPVEYFFCGFPYLLFLNLYPL